LKNLFQVLGQILCHHSPALDVHVNRVIEKVVTGLEGMAESGKERVRYSYQKWLKVSDPPISVADSNR